MKKVNQFSIEENNTIFMLDLLENTKKRLEALQQLTFDASELVKQDYEKIASLYASCKSNKESNNGNHTK